MPQAPKRPGRPPLWPEKALLSFPEGTFSRIAALLDGSEERTDFVRVAVERELQRREALKSGAGRG